MRVSLVLVILFLLPGCVAYNPDPLEWVITWGGQGADYAHSIAIDDDGNILIAGYFEDTVDFDPGPQTTERTSEGDFDSFLACYDPDGNFNWVLTWGGVNPCYALAVHTSGSGIVVGGIFKESVDLDPGEGIEVPGYKGSRPWVYLVKLNTDREFEWAQSWGCEETQYSSVEIDVILTDSQENVIVCGSYYGPVDFNPGTGIYSRNFGYIEWAEYISKFDANGNWQWTRVWEGIPSIDALIDSEDCILVGGGFGGEVDFNPDGDEPAVHSVPDVPYDEVMGYIVRYGPDGEFMEVRTQDDRISDLVQDAEGDLYICGTSMNENAYANLENPTMSDFLDANSAYLIRETPEGVKQWEYSWEESDMSWCTDIACDGNGNICVVGIVRPTDFHNMFVSFIDSDGGFRNMTTFTGEFYQQEYDLGVDGQGYVYLVGGFADETHFGELESQTRMSNGRTDVFLVKFSFNPEW